MNAKGIQTLEKVLLNHKEIEYFGYYGNDVNAVKCNLTKLTTKRSWYLSSGQRSAVGSVAYRSGFCS